MGEVKTVRDPDTESGESAVEIRTRPVKCNEKATADMREGGPREMQKARDDEWYRQIMCCDRDTGAQPLDELILQVERGLAPRRPITLQNTGVKQQRELRTAQDWKMPRAWDPKEIDQHYAPLYAHLSPAEYAAKMLAILRDLRHEAVEPRWHEVLYNIAVSGFYMGPNKRHNKDEHICRRCGTHTNGSPMQGSDETLEHAYSECAEVDSFWKMLITDWNAQTGENLKPEDIRVRLLGDRGTEKRAATEEAWHVVHAAACWPRAGRYTPPDSPAETNNPADAPNSSQNRCCVRSNATCRKPPAGGRQRSAARES